MKNNDTIRAVIAEIEAAGAEVLGITQPKHTKIRLSHNGVEHTIIAGTSPSDCRAHIKARAFVRRILREQGEQLEPAEEKAAEPTEEHRVRQPPHPMRGKPKGKPAEPRAVVLAEAPIAKAPRVKASKPRQPAKPARPSRPPHQDSRSANALRDLEEMSRGMTARWSAMMTWARKRQESSFLFSLYVARCKGGEGMGLAMWKQWSRLEKRLTPEHAAKLEEFTKPFEIELRLAAKTLRNELPTELRASYINALHVIRLNRKLRRAEKRAEASYLKPTIEIKGEENGKHSIEGRTVPWRNENRDGGDRVTRNGTGVAGCNVLLRNPATRFEERIFAPRK